jgi:hypothetical protein
MAQQHIYHLCDFQGGKPPIAWQPFFHIRFQTLEKYP